MWENLLYASLLAYLKKKKKRNKRNCRLCLPDLRLGKEMRKVTAIDMGLSMLLGRPTLQLITGGCLWSLDECST